MEGSLKGVILAGGTGSRLHPLTRITNKHLLPIYDRPMVTYAIEALVKAGVTELMLVTGGEHPREVLRPVPDRHRQGVRPDFPPHHGRAGGNAEDPGRGRRLLGRQRVRVI